MRKRTRIAVATVLALVAVVAFPPGAQAVGELTSGGCIDDNDSGIDVCAQSVNGLGGPGAVAVSADGRSVYVASFSDDAIVRFNRSPTGALTPAGCVDDNDTGEDVCAQSVNGLAGANAVTVSPDGKSVYAVSFTDNAIVRFNRDSTGALTPAGCVDDNDNGADVCAQSVNGLAGANGVAVSPDGESVYVASNFDDAVVRFNRGVSGALTPAGCVDDNDTGEDVCALSVNGLNGAVSVTVSPDGKSVYTAAPEIVPIFEGDNAIVRFNRSDTGALTSGGCVDDKDSGADVCAQTVDGLTGVGDVHVSPDSKSLYAASFGDSAIVRFNRSSLGALTPAGCIEDNDAGPDTCAESTDGLSFANSVTVSPDGDSVYVTSAGLFLSDGDAAVVRFDRTMSGALSPAGCVDDNDTGPEACAQAVNGLESPGDSAVSPDGASLYVTSSGGDDAVVRFNRQV